MVVENWARSQPWALSDVGIRTPPSKKTSYKGLTSGSSVGTDEALERFLCRKFIGSTDLSLCRGNQTWVALGAT